MRPSWRLAVLARLAPLAAVVACPIGASAAQIEDFLDRPVVEVRLLQEGQSLDDAVVWELVQTRVGQPLHLNQVRETMAHLFGLGRFQDIRVVAARVESGVSLTYELIPLHAVGRMEFRGSPGLSESRLRSTIVDRFGAAPSVGRAANMVETLTALYRDYGYQHASVKVHTEVEHAPERTTLVFVTESGPQAMINGVSIEGNPLQPRGQLLGRLNVESGTAYNRPEILAGIERGTDDLRERGYYEARIDHRAAFSADGKSVEVTITVEPGPHVEVVFEGDPLPSRERTELVPVRREGSVDEDLLEDSKRAIETYLHNQGYRDAVVEVTRSGDGREQRIVFTVARGPRYVVSEVTLDGVQSLTSSGVEQLLRVEAGDPFVRADLDAALGRLAEAYRRVGFVGASVKVDAASPPPAAGMPGRAEIPVALRVAVTEGVQTVVGDVTFEGNEAVPPETLSSALSLRTGEPYYPPRLTTDLDAVVLQYLNRGFQTASADAKVEFSPDKTRANIRFVIAEGPQVFIDHILVVGNNRTRVETIQRELVVRAGQPLSFSDIIESQRRLSALGLFRRVRITELRHPSSETRRDLLVTVEEAPLTTVGYGLGVEGGRRLRRTEEDEGAVEVFEFVPRGFFEVGRRNLWGKNRAINLFMRATLRERETFPADPSPENPDPPAPDGTYGFTEYRVLGTFREPRVFSTGADALVTAYLEQGVRSSFNFNRRGVRAEVGKRVTRTLSLSGRYSFDRTRLFDEQIAPEDQNDIDRLFPRVRLSAFSASALHDTRDDALDPARGGMVGIDGEVAARAIGSEVGFAKTFLHGFIYRRIPSTRRIVFAGGARLGVATGFPREVNSTDENGDPILDPDGNPVMEELRDVPASERFYAGGDTTVRGFALDRLGRPDTFDADGFPKGGHALVIFNAELRVPVWRDLGAVGFVDSGNVFALVDDLDLSLIKGAAGFGIRYRSPIGPLRIDLGFKLTRDRFANGELERRTALHISLGQAF